MNDALTFSNLFESFPDAIIIINRDGLIEMINSRALHIFGYSENEINGKGLNLLIQSDNRAVHSDLIKDYLKNPGLREMSDSINIYGLPKDRTKLPLEIGMSPLILDNNEMIIVTVRDITKRKEYEQKLRNSHLQHENLIMNHPHGIIETLLNGTITIANKAYARLYGFEYEGLVGRKAWEIVQDDNVKREIQNFYLESQYGNLIPDTRIEERKTIDGKTIQIQIDWDYRVDSAGKKIGHTIVVTDVTKFKEIEKDLRISQNRLRALSTNLQDKIEAERSKIAREVHDELGQVLTAINMEIDYLIDELEENEKISSQKLSENLHSIGKLIERLILTVQNISTDLRPDILDHLGLYAAIEWQLQEFEERFKIKTKINNFVESINLSEEKTINIYRIFQETLTNIARHSEAKEVNVNFELINDILEINIADDGIGIDKNILNDIKSIGILGMMERVNILGGKISIQNVRNGGTEVHLKVPLK